MRIHKDTGYYYIGNTDVGLLKRHKTDISHAKRGVKLGSNITGFIWGILLRDGDPVEEFELVELEKYNTKKEADDAERILISKYYKGKGDMPGDKMLNNKVFKLSLREIYNKKGNLRGYEVHGRDVYVCFSNNKNYRLEELREFAEEYIRTGTIPENYERSSAGRVKCVEKC